MILGQRREAHGHAQRAEVARGVAAKEGQRVLGRLEAEARHDGVCSGRREIGHEVARAVGARVRRLRRAVFEDAARVHGPLGEHASQLRVVVDEQRSRQRLQRRAVEIPLGHDGVLLLEVERGPAHGGVVRAGLVLRGIKRALADEPLLDLGEGRALGLAAAVRLDVLGVARVRRGQGLEGFGARLGARCLEPQLAELVAGHFLLFGRRAPGRDLVDGEQLGDVDGRRRRAIAGAGGVGEEARAQHAQRRRHAVEIEVVLVARLERLAVAVGPIAREAREHGAVAVGEDGPAGTRTVVEDRRRPPVAEIDERETARARDVGVDDALDAGRHLNGAPLRRHGGRGRQRVDVGDGQRRQPVNGRRQ